MTQDKDLDKLPETKVGTPSRAPARKAKGVTMKPEGTSEASKIEVPVAVAHGVQPGTENEVTLKVQSRDGDIEVTTKRINH